MADYDLTQTGQEVQDILDGAAMQTDLTAETERAELAEQSLQGGIDAEETRAKAAEKQNADDIDVIEAKIPAGASDQNQLADKEFVNNSIATATATFRGAYNLVNDLSLTVGATHEQIASALAGAISTADNNDYCFVQIPTADATPTQIASIERYKFNGTAWAYEYTLNNSGFTAAQWAALNSGITSGLVAKLLALPTNDALTLALAGKQDVLTFDSVPVDGSNNPVKSGGVYSAIGDEETRAKAAEKANADDIDNIEALIPATASDENQLADKEYVNDGIATASATYRGSFNEVNDLSLTTDATHEQIATALAGAISTADNNDYCFVQIPTSDAAPTQIASIERYKFNGTAWAYEYTLNNSGFTAAQWAALNSGITSGLVAKLSALPTNDALTLALAGKQDVLTFDNEPTSGSNNPVKSGGVYDAIDVEATTRAAAIAAIVALIPEAASALNQLADKSFVNSSISTATAVFKGTYNVVVDLELSYNATQEQIATMLASKIISADNNDYCFVQIPTSDAAPLQIARTDRYKFNGTAWAYEYTLNNSGFTAAQWAAINSGITSLLKDKLIDLPTATELTALLAAKQNQLTFDTTPTTGSTNPVTSGGIKSAIDAEKARAEAAEADRYTKSETYNKTEINGMVSTPHQNYVTVPTYASLPSSGQSTDTIYRVSSYDGANSQVDDTVYSEYAWDGTQYVFLCVKSQIEEVFDITVYNNNTKYADLSAALGVDGANIPATLRRGGMSVKFVQSSDNNYIQARLMADSFTTDVTKWQSVDNEPSAGSDNLVKSGGAKNYIDLKDEAIEIKLGHLYKETDKYSDGWTYVKICPIKTGETYKFTLHGQSGSPNSPRIILYMTEDGTFSEQNEIYRVTGYNTYEGYSNSFVSTLNGYLYFMTRITSGNVGIEVTSENSAFGEIDSLKSDIHNNYLLNSIYLTDKKVFEEDRINVFTQLDDYEVSQSVLEYDNVWTQEGLHTSIPVNENDIFIIKGYKYNSYFPVYLMRKNGEIVSYESTLNDGLNQNIRIEIPAGVDELVINSNQTTNLYVYKLMPNKSIPTSNYTQLQLDMQDNVLDRWNTTSTQEGQRASIPVIQGERYIINSFKYGSDGFPAYLLRNKGTIVSYNNDVPAGMPFGGLKVTIPSGVDELVVNATKYFCEVWKEECIKPARYSNWAGKKILWLGTSIPEKSNYTPNGNYPEQVAKALGAEVINVALGSSMARKGFLSKVTADDTMGITGVGFVTASRAMGMTIAEKQELIDNWNTKWDAIINGSNLHGNLTDAEKELMLSASYENKLIANLDDVDLVVFDHGRNDYSSNSQDNQMSTDNPFDMRTFQGAMNSYIKMVFENDLHKKVVMISHYESQQFPGLIAMQEEVANYWGIPIFRLCDKLGWAYNRKINLNGHWIAFGSGGYYWEETENSYEYRLTQAHIPDGTHPNTDLSGVASRDIAQKIIPFINDLGMTDY